MRDWEFFRVISIYLNNFAWYTPSFSLTEFIFKEIPLFFNVIRIFVKIVFPIYVELISHFCIVPFMILNTDLVLGLFWGAYEIKFQYWMVAASYWGTDLFSSLVNTKSSVIGLSLPLCLVYSVICWKRKQSRTHSMIFFSKLSVFDEVVQNSQSISGKLRSPKTRRWLFCR